MDVNATVQHVIVVHAVDAIHVLVRAVAARALLRIATLNGKIISFYTYI